MKKRSPLIWAFTIFIILAIAASLVLSSLSNRATPTPTPDQPFFTPTLKPSPTSAITQTPDWCSPEYLPIIASDYHRLMRQFDDIYTLAQNTPIQSVSPLISDLQTVRRNAEDYVVPPCMVAMKQKMLTHMNTVIETLLAFISGANPDAINKGVADAQAQHNAYMVEFSVLVGWTLPAPPITTFEALTETPSP